MWAARSARSSYFDLVEEPGAGVLGAGATRGWVEAGATVSVVAERAVESSRVRGRWAAARRQESELHKRRGNTALSTSVARRRSPGFTAAAKSRRGCSGRGAASPSHTTSRGEEQRHLVEPERVVEEARRAEASAPRARQRRRRRRRSARRRSGRGRSSSVAWAGRRRAEREHRGVAAPEHPYVGRGRERGRDLGVVPVLHEPRMRPATAKRSADKNAPDRRQRSGRPRCGRGSRTPDHVGLPTERRAATNIQTSCRHCVAADGILCRGASAGDRDGAAGQILLAAAEFQSV